MSRLTDCRAARVCAGEKNVVAEAVGITRRLLLRLARPGALGAAIAAAAACGGAEGPRAATGPARVQPTAGWAATPPPRPTSPPRLVATERIAIDVPRVTGLSDLTADGAGRLWSVAERTRAVVRMRADGSAPHVLALEGVPDGLDVEGLAWLEGDRFALATEADDPRRTSDLLLFARVRDGGTRMRVERTVSLDYGLWPMHPRGNQGMEGLCRAGRRLVASIESVVTSGARRLAPIAVHDVDGGHWTPYYVVLTTGTGKLSALSCRPRGGAIDVLAIERHFEVARLIRFELPAPPSAGRPPSPPELVPVLVADLAPLLRRRENFEGLLWDGERTITVVADNDWATVTGPNLVVRARLSAPAPAPPVPPRPTPAPSPPGRRRR
jgi:Esterase-like activity of phytase